MKEWINNKFFKIVWTNPLKEYNKIKRFFKPLTRKIQFGNYKRVGGFPIYTNHIAKILDIRAFNVSWKDKYNSPRHEYNPHVVITLFKTWKLLITWEFIDFNGEDHSMEYWEAALSWLYYDSCLGLSVKENTGWYKTVGNERIYIEYSLLLEPWQTMYNNDDLPKILYKNVKDTL